VGAELGGARRRAHAAALASAWRGVRVGSEREREALRACAARLDGSLPKLADFAAAAGGALSLPPQLPLRVSGGAETHSSAVHVEPKAASRSSSPKKALPGRRRPGWIGAGGAGEDGSRLTREAEEAECALRTIRRENAALLATALGPFSERSEFVLAGWPTPSDFSEGPT
jgi:hypothetical protein